MAYNSSYISLALETLRPGLIPNVDFELADLQDGNGPFISAWHRDDIQQPTVAELEAVDTEALLIPQAVTPRQARLALLGAGLLDQVQSAVDAAGGATKITWEYATVINRDDPLIATLGSALSLTPAQIDQLFTQAATL